MVEYALVEHQRRRAGRPRGAVAGNPETRNQILRAARALFGSSGYDTVTVRAIADRAGVAAGLVNHYFGSKEQLFIDCLHFAMADFVPTMRAARIQSDDRPRAVARVYFAMWETPEVGDFLRLVMINAGTNDAARHALQEFVEQHIVRAVISGGEAEHRPERVLSGSMVAAVLMGVAVSRYVNRLEPLAGLGVDELVERTAPLLESLIPTAPFVARDDAAKP